VRELVIIAEKARTDKAGRVGGWYDSKLRGII
jgi:hypothetical protein